jgi:hypothetical protein
MRVSNQLVDALHVAAITGLPKVNQQRIDVYVNALSELIAIKLADESAMILDGFMGVTESYEQRIRGYDADIRGMQSRYDNLERNYQRLDQTHQSDREEIKNLKLENFEIKSEARPDIVAKITVVDTRQDIPEYGREITGYVYLIAIETAAKEMRQRGKIPAIKALRSYPGQHDYGLLFFKLVSEQHPMLREAYNEIRKENPNWAPLPEIPVKVEAGEGEPIKTIAEWAKDEDMIILDPDGFDRSRADLWEMKITKAEFDKGKMGCTTGPLKWAKSQEEQHHEQEAKSPTEDDKFAQV